MAEEVKEIPKSEWALQRYLYTRDISSAPVINLLLKQVDVIYQPRDEKEVIEVLRIAEKEGATVVPRGAGTSGYGGVLPPKDIALFRLSKRKTIMIDFTRMDNFEIDEEKQIVACSPGAVWWDIEKELNKKDLTLRVYPTSAPSSTVAGWIAQNGYGVGSLKYGGIADNVEKIRVVDFNGVREIEGKDLKYYVGMEGITGLITKAWVKVKEMEDMKYYGFHVSAKEANKIVFAGEHYAGLFLDAGYVKLKNEAFGTEMPEKDVLMIATTEKLDGDESLGEEIWEKRFYPMRVRRLGPGLVAAENVLPAESIPAYLNRLNKMIKKPHGSEIWYSKGKKGAVLTFIPSDERKFIGYTMTWLNSIRALKTAKRMRGVPYSTGFYLSSEAKLLLGSDYAELREFKRQVDPKNQLNPGKVFPTGALPLAMRIAQKVIP
ncbi:MAG: FAD-binding oxidoreductase [Archaeoglobales archaeon]|nr:FAD-binding oxidoreductase [Archaeoglobales archaeon]